MSFDLFVSPLPDAAWGVAERQKIIEILYRDTEATDEFYSVRYADGSGAREISGLDDWDEGTDKSTGLCFRRFGGKTFEQRLYELADQLDAMVFWPGDPPFVAVTRQELFSMRPPELTEDDVVVVRDAEELMTQICK